MKSSEHLVFVYGTLKKGLALHDVLLTSRYLGQDSVEGAIYTLGWFPGYKRGTGVVHGEVYAVSTRTLADLDRIEGEGSMYIRETIRTYSGRQVWIYRYAGVVSERSKIESGTFGEQPHRVFNYGSNLSTERFLDRCPSAVLIDTGRLAEHRLEWHKRGGDGTGKADAFYTGHEDDEVYGAVYEISARDKRALDGFEGLGFAYTEKAAEIATDDGTLKATVYVALDIRDGLRPSEQYHGYVLDGAIEHNFPTYYIEDNILDVPVAPERRQYRVSRQYAQVGDYPVAVSNDEWETFKEWLEERK